MSRSVDELYRKLSSVADELRLQQGRTVSVNQALRHMIESMRPEATDFSWSWRIKEIDFRKIAQRKNPVPRSTKCTNRHE